MIVAAEDDNGDLDVREEPIDGPPQAPRIIPLNLLLVGTQYKDSGISTYRLEGLVEVDRGLSEVLSVHGDAAARFRQEERGRVKDRQFAHQSGGFGLLVFPV